MEAIYRPSLHLWGLGFGWLGGGEGRGGEGGGFHALEWPGCSMASSNDDIRS